MLKKIIQSVKLFQNLSEEELEILISISSISKYTKDTVLFYETDSTR